MTVSRAKPKSNLHDPQGFLITACSYLMLKSVLTPLVLTMTCIITVYLYTTFVFKKWKHGADSNKTITLGRFARNVVFCLFWLITVIWIVYLCFSVFGISMMLPAEPGQNYVHVPMENKKSREKDKFYMERTRTFQSSVHSSKGDVFTPTTQKKNTQRFMARNLARLKMRRHKKYKTVQKTNAPSRNQYSHTNTNMYENGQIKFQEHHHGESKKFLDTKYCSYLYGQFHSDPFGARNFVTMVTTPDNQEETEEELQHLQLGNTRELMANNVQPVEVRNHRQPNPQQYAVGPSIDLNQHRSRSQNSLTSLIASRTSSGFNSLTLYDEYNDGVTSRRNDILFQSGVSSRQSYRPPSSGYESGRRRQTLSSSGISFSPRMQVDEYLPEEQNLNLTENLNLPDQHFCSEVPSENQALECT